MKLNFIYESDEQARQFERGATYDPIQQAKYRHVQRRIGKSRQPTRLLRYLLEIFGIDNYEVHNITKWEAPGGPNGGAGFKADISGQVPNAAQAEAILKRAFPNWVQFDNTPGFKAQAIQTGEWAFSFSSQEYDKDGNTYFGEVAYTPVGVDKVQPGSYKTGELRVATSGGHDWDPSDLSWMCDCVGCKPKSR